MTGFVRDITERRQLEEQLRQSQKLEAIGRLAGGVAHDFNNILIEHHRIGGPVRCDAKADDPLVRRRRDQAVGRARRPVSRVSFWRSAGGRRHEPQMFDLDAVVGDMETMLRRLIGAGDRLPDRAPPSPTVKADPAQIEQVVLNLVVNARDAMPEGGHLTFTLDERRCSTRPPRAW